MFNLLTYEELKGFFIEHLPARELPYRNLFQNSITFEISQTQTVFYRRIFSILDMMGNLGGLYGALVPLCLSIVRIFHYRSSYMHIAGEVFGIARMNS